MAFCPSRTYKGIFTSQPLSLLGTVSLHCANSVMSHTASQNAADNAIPSTAQPGEDGSKPQSLPKTLPNICVEGISKLPKLSREQCGHIRHFHNLASQPEGDWSLMQGASGQEYDDSSYRYQLATMAYATGAAHYHRLPALRGVFRSLLQKLIAKMLQPEVWGYWYLTSQSGKTCDPDIEVLRKPWADPVCKENVMVSDPQSRYAKRML